MAGSNIKKSNEEIMKKILKEKIEQIKSNPTHIVQFIGEGEKSKQKIFRLIEVVPTKEGENRVEDESTEIEEQNSQEKYNQIEMFYTYSEEGLQLLGIKDNEGRLLPSEDFVQNSMSWDVFKEDIQQCLEDRQKMLEAVAKELGISEQEIDDLSEIDLTQKIAQKKEETKDEQEVEAENDAQKKEEDKEKVVLSERQVNSVKGEALNSYDLNQQVGTMGERLGEQLGLTEYSQIMIVHAHKLLDMKNAQGEKESRQDIQYAILGYNTITNRWEKIPEKMLTMDRDPESRMIGLTDNENSETRHTVTEKKHAEMFISPKTGARFAIDREPGTGMARGYLVKENQNSVKIGHELQGRRQGTETESIEVREMYSARRGDHYRKEQQAELDMHSNEDCEKTEKEMDTNLSTVTHFHNATDTIVYEGQTRTIQDFHDNVLGYRDYDVKATINEINNRLKNNEDIKEILEDMEETALVNYRGMNRTF